MSFSSSQTGLNDAVLPEVDIPPTASSLPQKQRHPGPDKPKHGVPQEHWPTIRRRIQQGEPLRRVAQDYAVSYQTIWRIARSQLGLKEGES